jgi:F-type H+-transporting ATPase subunit b
MLNRVILCLTILMIGAAMVSPVLASGASTGEGDINPLALSAWKADLAIWTGVVFLVLLAVLWKLAWKPIAEGLDKREQNVADQIAQAEQANQKAKDILSDYERKLAGAQDQVRAILDQGRRHAEQLGQEMLDKAKEEAKLEYERAVKQIDAATSAAIKELADQSATLAVDLAGKIVRSKLNPSDHARLIDQAVAGFAPGKSDPSKASQN